jgi:hypothetical protein
MYRRSGRSSGRSRSQWSAIVIPDLTWYTTAGVKASLLPYVRCMDIRGELSAFVVAVCTSACAPSGRHHIDKVGPQSLRWPNGQMSQMITNMDRSVRWCGDRGRGRTVVVTVTDPAGPSAAASGKNDSSARGGPAAASGDTNSAREAFSRPSGKWGAHSASTEVPKRRGAPPWAAELCAAMVRWEPGRKSRGARCALASASLTSRR